MFATLLALPNFTSKTELKYWPSQKNSSHDRLVIGTGASSLVNFCLPYSYLTYVFYVGHCARPYLSLMSQCQMPFLALTLVFTTCLLQRFKWCLLLTCMSQWFHCPEWPCYTGHMTLNISLVSTSFIKWSLNDLWVFRHDVWQVKNKRNSIVCSSTKQQNGSDNTTRLMNNPADVLPNRGQRNMVWQERSKLWQERSFSYLPLFIPLFILSSAFWNRCMKGTFSKDGVGVCVCVCAQVCVCVCVCVWVWVKGCQLHKVK